MSHSLQGRLAVSSLAQVAAGICLFLSAPASAQEIKLRTTLNIEGIAALAFSPDGKTLATGSRGDKTVKLWDVVSGKSITTLESGEDRVNALTFSPDGKTLASFGDYTITLLDVGSRKAKALLKTHSGCLGDRQVVFSPDGKTLASGGDSIGDIEVWNVASGKKLMELEETGGDPWSTLAMEFSSDGKSLISASPWRDGILQSDLATGKTTAVPFLDGERSIKQTAISRNGKVAVAWASEDRIFIRDIAAGKIRVGHKDLKGGAYAPALSPDGKILAFDRLRGAIKIWDMENEKEIATLQGGGWIRRLVFSRDGNLLASVNDDDVVMVWDVPKAK